MDSKSFLVNYTINNVQNITLQECTETDTSQRSVRYVIGKQYRRKIRNSRLLTFARKKKSAIVKNKNYVETIKKFSDGTFFSHFRMNRDCFFLLVNEIKETWKTKRKGRPGDDIETFVYIALWWLSNQNSLREISDRFNYSIGWVYQKILKVCKAINKLSEKYIKWPTSDEFLEIYNGFENCRPGNKFPLIAGCIDGTHIKIRTPSQDSCSYYNRKGYHSLILQGICDNNLLFRDIFFGWPGSSHDACVWRNSPIGQALEAGTLKLPHNGHLLGDSAYPLLPYLITPYRDNGHLSQREKSFNQLHSSIRVSIEQAFGILKSKFRILNNITFHKIADVKYIVLSTIVLHNFIRIHSPNLNILAFSYLDLSQQHDNQEDDESVVEMEHGVTKRDTICEWLVPT